MRKRAMTLLVAIAVASSTSVLTGVANADGEPKPNQFWWPDQLDLSPLRKNEVTSNPYGPNFNYRKAFQTLNLNAVKADIKKVLTTSQDWWPADYGNYGPFFVRMAWHSAGTYRVVDGRGGASGGEQRFDPLNSWPDNANLDKARRLLLPIKEKYGRNLSWADLMVLTGNVALESMGFKTYGFAGGREDAWEPDLVYWGPEKTFLSDARHAADGKLEKPLGASQMGLIYVNPEGPSGNPDPLAAAKEIRQTFGRMAMNDEETVALIAGGHTFGKAHGAHDASKCLGAAPAGAGIEQQDTGWVNNCGTGKGADAITSGLEGAWSASPTTFTTQYLDNLFAFDWIQTHSPSGALQWMPADAKAANLVPDAHDATTRHPPMMFTTDLALKVDPSYREIAERFHDHPDQFELAFAKAWFKLTHRDMGPRIRYLGPDAPKEELAWEDPLPKADHKPINAQDVAALKSDLLATGLTGPELIRTAWASASSFRSTDKRGGANGARIRLAPQKDWAVNNPNEMEKVLEKLEAVQKRFNSARSDGKKVSVADLIVLGGNAAIEQAAKNAGFDVQVPFARGRVDASQAQTDVASFSVMEPAADSFRNFYGDKQTRSPAESLVDKADALGLTVPEMTALIGGMRVLNANFGGSSNGVLTTRPGTLSNDFFVNLLDMSTQWSKAKGDGLYEGRDRTTGKLKWMATSVDLIFGSNSELRAVSEVYASSDAKEMFVKDFVNAWTKVMNNDRFDLAS